MYVMCLLLKFKKLFPLHMVKKSYPGRTSIFFTWWVMKCMIAFYTCDILFPSPMVLFTCSDFSASWIHFLCSVVATCQFFGFIPDAMVTFSGLLIFCFRYVFDLAVSKLGSWINSWYSLNLSLPPGIQGGGMGREGSCILLCVETGFLITISSKGILQYILLTWHFFYQKWQLLCGHLFHSPVCCFGASTLLFSCLCLYDVVCVQVLWYLHSGALTLGLLSGFFFLGGGGVTSRCILGCFFF